MKLKTRLLLPPPNLEILSAQTESILFASGDPVLKSNLKEILSINEKELNQIIEILNKKYNKPDSGLILLETLNTLQLGSNPIYYPVLKDLFITTKKRNLTKAASEVLAIVAYKAPITRVEIDQIRGVHSKAALLRLIDLGLVKENGRKKVPGRPRLYVTTEDFLRLVGIKKITDLPHFEEFN